MRQRLLNSAISLARPTPCRAHRVTCQLHYQLLCQAPRQPQLRPFTSTIAAHKKAHKSSKHDADQEITATPTSNPAQASKSPIDDPSDFTDLDAGIGQALERLTANLSKLRAGGRFNHELVEELRVKLDKNKSDTERLGDLAQVIPKTGRVLVVMVAEESFIKPLTSTILASPYSLSVVPSSNSPLELNVNIPPPTQESRRQTLDQASKMGEQASTAVRNVRAIQQKRLRDMKVNKKARPDDLKRAGDKMEKIVEKGLQEVRRVTEGARKSLEG